MLNKKETKLQHIMKMSWESEQMPGWEDSLSVILEATKKEFQLKNKESSQMNMQENKIQKEAPMLEDDFSM